jgi:hypothetical protein
MVELGPLEFNFESIHGADDSGPALWPWEVGFPSLLLPVDIEVNTCVPFNDNCGTVDTGTSQTQSQH